MILYEHECIVFALKLHDDEEAVVENNGMFASAAFAVRFPSLFSYLWMR